MRLLPGAMLGEGREELDGFLYMTAGVWRRAIGFVSIDDVNIGIELADGKPDGLAKNRR